MPFDPEVPQTAPEAQPIPFDQALQDLVQALMEGGATPKQAERAVEQATGVDPRTAYRSPRLGPQRPQVGAGDYGLPHLPPVASNRLAGEMRSTLSPEGDSFMWATGAPTVLGKEVDTLARLGRPTGDVVSRGVNLPSMLGIAAAEQAGEIGKKAAEWSFATSQAQAAGRSPEQIAEEQKELTAAGYYGGKIDGVEGDETKKARRAYQADAPKRQQQEFDRKNQELEAARIRAQQGGNEAEIAKANAAVAAAEAEQKRIAAAAETERIKNEQRDAGNKRMQDMEKNAGWFSKAVRDYSVPLGVAFGFGAGMLTRGGTVRGSDYFSRQKAASGDAAMRNALSSTPEVTAADLNTRVGAVNDFWRRGQRSPSVGGAPEVPYTVTPNTAPGVQANLNAPPSAALYQPNKLMNAVVDVGIPAAFVAESEIVRNRYGDPARAEVREATAAAERDPSEVNLRRLRAALDNETIAAGFENFGRLGAMGYGARAMKTQRNPTSPSAMPSAEAEQLAINDYLRRFSAPPQAPPGPPPAPVRTWQDQTRVNGRWGPHR